MQGAASLRPLGDRIVVTRTEGHGIETVTAGGIILPATREASVQTKGDYFRARVEAMSAEAARLMPDLSVGDDVLVYSYAGEGDRLFTGEETQRGLCIRPDDILAAVDG